jgi:hypothetical protein
MAPALRIFPFWPDRRRNQKATASSFAKTAKVAICLQDYRHRRIFPIFLDRSLGINSQLSSQIDVTATKRINAMNHSVELGQTEEKILTYEVSDGALEAAAGTMRDKAGSFTVSFCSGLDTCPT